jgi:hypothetical protein
MNDPMRFFVCTMATGTDWLEGAMLIVARSEDEAAAVFKEHEAVDPLKTYEIKGAGVQGGMIGRIEEVGGDYDY